MLCFRPLCLAALVYFAASADVPNSANIGRKLDDEVAHPTAGAVEKLSSRIPPLKLALSKALSKAQLKIIRTNSFSLR